MIIIWPEIFDLHRSINLKAYESHKLYTFIDSYQHSAQSPTSKTYAGPTLVVHQNCKRQVKSFAYILIVGKIAMGLCNIIHTLKGKKKYCTEALKHKDEMVLFLSCRTM